jgi:HSP20 family protein
VTNRTRWEEKTMQVLKPWTGMTTLKTEMDRLFERFLEPVWAEMPTLGEWEPKIDVTESKDTVTVKVDLPGVDQKDIGVSLEGGVLTIKGEKRQEREEKEKGWYLMERSFGSFLRQIPLPVEVEEDRVEARFDKGVLHVSLPKSAGAEARARKIEIKGG